VLAGRPVVSSDGTCDHIVILCYWYLQFRKWGFLFDKERATSTAL
jgi:hypothetical protein